MTLEEIRREIDGIDLQIIGLLSERGKLVTAAGALKKSANGVRDPKRVEQVIERVKEKAAGAGLAPEIAEKIYRAIIASFVEKELLEFDHRNEKGGLT